MKVKRDIAPLKPIDIDTILLSHYNKKGGGGGSKLFNENLFSIFDMGPLIDFRLTIK